MTKVFQAFALVFVALLAAPPLTAQGVPPASGSVVLTVTGNVAVTNTQGAAELDIDALQLLGTRTIETTTIWTEGVQRFEGVPLDVLVSALGLTGQTLRATAINDYAVDIPMTDATPEGAIVAFRLNEEPMSLRDKGPLWIIYPYDSKADFRTEVVYSRSIWQRDRLEALD